MGVPMLRLIKYLHLLGNNYSHQCSFVVSYLRVALSRSYRLRQLKPTQQADVRRLGWFLLTKETALRTEFGGSSISSSDFPITSSTSHKQITPIKLGL
jgi:hypothetical protein